MPENIEEMVILAQLGKDMGADNFQIKPCHNHPKSSHNPPLYQYSHEGLEKAMANIRTESYKIKVRTASMERLTEARTYENCWGFDFWTLISARGDVLPCNIFYDEPDFFYGNINEKSFSKIWNSKRRKEVIEKVHDLCFEKCGVYRCRLDPPNRDLERIIHPHINDEFM